jgi:hypothetical protein
MLKHPRPIRPARMKRFSCQARPKAPMPPAHLPQLEEALFNLATRIMPADESRRLATVARNWDRALDAVNVAKAWRNHTSPTPSMRKAYEELVCLLGHMHGIYRGLSKAGVA